MDSSAYHSVCSELIPASKKRSKYKVTKGGSFQVQDLCLMEHGSDAVNSPTYLEVMRGGNAKTVRKSSHSIMTCKVSREVPFSQSCDDSLCWAESPAIKPPPEFQDTSSNSTSPLNSPMNSPQGIHGKNTRPHAGSVTAARLTPARLRPDVPEWLEKIAIKMVTQVLEEALLISGKLSWSIQCSEECHPRRDSDESHRKHLSVPGLLQPVGPRLCWTPELPYSLRRPPSRSSLSSRLSSSHNSLSVPAANRADDSSFITSAMSHEVLSSGDISDMYNVPVDCDVYAVPVDVVRPPHPLPPQRPKRQRQQRRKRKQSNAELESNKGRTLSSHTVSRPHALLPEQTSGKRHVRAGRPGRSASMECTTQGEPIHMTLAEVRRYLSNLYSSSSDSSDYRRKLSNTLQSQLHTRMVKSKPIGGLMTIEKLAEDPTLNGPAGKTHRKSTFSINVRNKKSKESSSVMVLGSPIGSECMLLPEAKPKRGLSFSSTLKQTFCNMFRFRRVVSPELSGNRRDHTADNDVAGDGGDHCDASSSPQLRPRFSTRALPPLPSCDAGDVSSTEPLEELTDETQEEMLEDQEQSVDFASSIEKVKDYGWYWGPISGEAAEKILSNEPDGSFIVRDSSDDHYIFSLTFKLNGYVRHVRIEQDQGNFSFGSCTKFKSHTIVDFIENAVEHSRSGRYLFFLHRRPVLGPMRVQLLHPVSRFKQVQSLQHICRFVILKVVRRDLISDLPLPRRLIDYLSTPHYYSEQLAEEELSSVPAAPSSPSLGEQGLFPYVPQGFS